MSRLLKVDNCNECIFYCEGECDLTREAVGFTIPDNCPMPDYEQLIEQIQTFEKYREKQRHINNTFETRLSSLEILIDNVNEYFQQHIQDCHRSQSRGCE